MKPMTLTIFGITMLSSLLVQAAPVMSPRCANAVHINSVKGGSGVIFDETCKTAYVLPPSTGNVTLESILASESMARCDEIDMILEDLQKITENIASLGTGGGDQAPEQSSGKPHVGKPGGQRPRSGTSAMSPTASEALSPEQETEVLKMLLKRKRLQENALAQYGNIVAAKAQINFAVDMNKLVSAYQNANANAGITFVAMPIKSAKMYFRPTELDRGLRLPLVLSSDVVGAQSSKDPGGHVSVDFGGSLAGDVQLSLFAACPLRTPVTNRLPRTIKASDLSAAMVTTVKYTYEVQASYKLVASYNLGELAKQIKESSSTGGFFQTSTVARLTNSEQVAKWFSFTSTCDDSRVCKTLDMKLVGDLKGQLVDSVLGKISMAQFGPPLSPGKAPSQPTTGAAVASEELRKCDSDYCKYSASVLDVLAATESGFSKTDEYIKSNDRWAEHRVEDKQMIEFTGTLAFSPKQWWE